MTRHRPAGERQATKQALEGTRVKLSTRSYVWSPYRNNHVSHSHKQTFVPTGQAHFGHGIYSVAARCNCELVPGACFPLFPADRYQSFILKRFVPSLQLQFWYYVLSYFVMLKKKDWNRLLRHWKNEMIFFYFKVTECQQ